MFSGISINSVNVTAALASFGLALSAGAASADTVNVKRGQTTAIYSIGMFNQDNCSSGPFPKITSVKAKNGTVTHRKSSGNITKGVCKGKKVKSVVILYKPNSGFTGKDVVNISWSFSRYTNTSIQTGKFKRLTVNVK